ncbi:MAG: hypothetical protein WBB67_03180 [bacterium]
MNKGKTKSQFSVVELLVNPFCMASRDVATIQTICAEHNIELKIYNLWEISDADIGNLPSYIATLIQEWRSGQRPGGVYSNVFVNGKRIPLNNWRGHLRTLGEEIISFRRKDNS